MYGFQQPFQNPYAAGQIAQQRIAQMPQAQNPYAPAPQPSDLLMVNGRESVDAFAMPPNSRALLVDSTRPLIYLKETDAAGMARVETFNVSPASDAPAEEYVTRREFEEWKAQHEPDSTEPQQPSTRTGGRCKQADADADA